MRISRAVSCTCIIFMSALLITLFLNPVSAAGGDKWNINVLSVTYPEGDMDRHVDVSSTFVETEIIRIGDFLNSNGNIPITLRDTIRWTWDQNEYPVTSVDEENGVADGDIPDVEDSDSDYYEATSVDVSEGNISKFVTSFIFGLDLTEHGLDNVRDMRIIVEGKVSRTPSIGEIQLFNGNEWKRKCDFDWTSEDDIEFFADDEYIQSNLLKIRIYTEASSSHEVKIDYVGVKFRSRDIDVSYTIPDDAMILSVEDISDEDNEIEYDMSSNVVNFNLFEYSSWEDDKITIGYTYTYDVTISEYAVTQKTDMTLDSSGSVDIYYGLDFDIAVPFSQEMTLKITTDESNLVFEGAKVDGKDVSPSNEDTDSVTFRISSDGENSAEISFYAEDAVSLTAEKVHNLTSTSIGVMEWVSEYIITPGPDFAVKNLTVVHNLLNGMDLNITKDDIKTTPETENTIAIEKSQVKITYPVIDEKLTITIKEYTKEPVLSLVSYTQLTDPLEIGVKPEFKAKFEIKNPSKVDYKNIEITEAEMLSKLPTEDEGIIKETVTPTSYVFSSVPKGGSSNMFVYFDASALSLNEERVTQHSTAHSEPIGWIKKIKIINPNNITCSNIKWSTELPADAIGYTINNGREFEIDGPELDIEYTEKTINPLQTKEYDVIYTTPAVVATETESSSGTLNKKFEKMIILENPGKRRVKIEISAATESMLNPEVYMDEKLLKDFEYIIDEYANPEDNITYVTAIDLSITMEANSVKEIRIKGDIGASSGSLLGLSDLGGILSFTVFGISPVIIIIPLFILGIILILFLREKEKRNRKMKVYQAYLETIQEK